MTDAFEHNRFLYTKDRNMHFGCINPFCGHGSPALPRHYTIPMETASIEIDISHDERVLTLNVFLKKKVGKHKEGELIILTCADNLPACEKLFGKLFAGEI